MSSRIFGDEPHSSFSCTEAAARLGVHPATLLRWQNEGKIAGFKVGREWRFLRATIYALERGSDEES